MADVPGGSRRLSAILDQVIALLIRFDPAAPGNPHDLLQVTAASLGRPMKRLRPGAHDSTDW